MSVIDGYEIAPVTPDRWDDLATVLGRSGMGGCWCMYWATPTTREWRAAAKGGSKAANRDALRALVDAGPPPGLIAYHDGKPAAWCRIMARSRLPGLARSRQYNTELATEGVWSLPCFVVRRQYRGRGLMTVLAKAAMELAREQGARTLEAYPWETDGGKAAAVIYTGVASTFLRLGFKEVQRKAPHKPMMQLSL
ncbi:MAG: GNAT family N-acetyltransferase [Alphaproteobacteria bacterium]